MTLKVEIASVPDRESLVAEIWSGSEMLGEVNVDDKGGLVVDIYSNGGANFWRLDLDEFVFSLLNAKSRLNEL